MISENFGMVPASLPVFYGTSRAPAYSVFSVTQERTFAGHGVLVTGSTGGIGQAIAEKFASQDANVVVTGRNRERGEAVARDLDGLGAGRATFIAADLATREGPMVLAATAAECLGGVDVLVNNAATGISGRSDTTSEEDWDAIYSLNVRAAYLLCGALIGRMVERGRGVVVSVSTSVGRRGWPGYAAYSSSKSALEAMTRAWAATYGRAGVRINAVAPGPVLTPLALRDSAEEDIAGFTQLYGLGRYGSTEEVAAAVAFLAGPSADYIHGTTLYVDGGMAETFGYQPISVREVGRPDARPKRLSNRIRRRFR